MVRVEHRANRQSRLMQSLARTRARCFKLPHTSRTFAPGRIYCFQQEEPRERVSAAGGPPFFWKQVKTVCYTTTVMHEFECISPVEYPPSTPPPVWEKVTKRRAGLRWDGVVEKVWKYIAGNQEEVMSAGKFGK